MKSLGVHSIVDCYDCDSILIDDLDYSKKIMLKSVELSGATVIDSVFHKFSPQGITGIIAIAESHFSIHTWPECGYCAIDIFTCGTTINNDIAVGIIKEGFKVERMIVSELKRGIV